MWKVIALGMAIVAGGCGSSDSGSSGDAHDVIEYTGAEPVETIIVGGFVGDVEVGIGWSVLRCKLPGDVGSYCESVTAEFIEVDGLICPLSHWQSAGACVLDLESTPADQVEYRISSMM